MFGKLGFGKNGPLVKDTIRRTPAPQVDHKIVVTSRKLQAVIHYLPKSYLVYMNNAKAGCSSIKSSLWSWRSPETLSNPHNKGASPFRHLFAGIVKDRKELETANVFTVVRNPYVRVLSAYLDKIATGKGGVAGKETRERFNIQGQTPSFSAFLDMIVTEEPELLDQHFAPQFYTTMHALIRYDFIGHLEEMEKVGSWLSQWKIPQEDFRPHATNAAEMFRQHYTDRDFALVRDYFAVDFEAFGYSDDPSVLTPVAPAKLPDVPRSNLADLVTAYGVKSAQRRSEAILRLKSNAPAIDLEYLRLDVQDMSAAEFEALAQDAEAGRPMSWQKLERLAELDLQAGNPERSARLLALAKKQKFPA